MGWESACSSQALCPNGPPFLRGVSHDVLLMGHRFMLLMWRRVTAVSVCIGDIGMQR